MRRFFRFLYQECLVVFLCHFRSSFVPFDHQCVVSQTPVLSKVLWFPVHGCQFTIFHIGINAIRSYLSIVPDAMLWKSWTVLQRVVGKQYWYLGNFSLKHRASNLDFHSMPPLPKPLGWCFWMLLRVNDPNRNEASYYYHLWSYCGSPPLCVFSMFSSIEARR